MLNVSYFAEEIGTAPIPTDFQSAAMTSSATPPTIINISNRALQSRNFLLFNVQISITTLQLILYHVYNNYLLVCSVSGTRTRTDLSAQGILLTTLALIQANLVTSRFVILSILMYI